MISMALFLLFTPPPPNDPGGLPLSVWANLPFLVCGAFALAILVGLFFIVRENRRVARQQAAQDALHTQEHK